ncbi:CBS domain-containing protein [Nocardiopsis flavescens]
MTSEDFAKKMSEFGLDGAGVEPPDFTSLLHQMDEDPESKVELDAIAARVDAEQNRYRGALAALDAGFHEEAEALLLQCAESGTGEADYLLAELLFEQGRVEESYVWYLHAAEQGDTRAFEALKKNFPSGRAGEELVLSRAEDDAWKMRLCMFLGSGKTSNWMFSYLPLVLPDLNPFRSRKPLVWDRLSTPSILELARHLYRGGHRPQPGDNREFLANLVFLWQHGGPDAEVYSRPPWDAAVVLQACQDRTPREIEHLRDSQTLHSPPDFSLFGPTDQAVELKDYDHGVGAAVLLDRRKAFEDADEQKRGFAYDAMVPRGSLPILQIHDTINDALEVFLEHGCRALPVEKEGTPIGCIRMKDVVRKSLSTGAPSIARLEEMIHPFTFVKSSASVEDVLRHISGTDDLVAVLGRGSSPIGFINSESLLSNAKRLAQESHNVIPMRKEENSNHTHLRVRDGAFHEQAPIRQEESELVFSSRFG